MLDIDAGSQYHNLKSLGKIRQCLAESGLKSTVLYRSSLSDGWHLYIFFAEPLSSRDLRHQIVLLLKLNDFVIEKGQLEVFPAPGSGPGSLGHGLRLPLQPGFAWLDPYDLEVIRDRLQLSPVKALQFFLQDLYDAPNTRQDFDRLKQTVKDAASGKDLLLHKIYRQEKTVISIRPEFRQQDTDLVAQVETVFGVLPPGMDAETWLKGRHYHLQGLSGPSQRAEAIFSLNHYLFYGDPQRELPALGYGYQKDRRQVVESVLTSRHYGYSKDINKSRPDALAQIERASEWLPPQRRESEPLKYQPAVVPQVWINANKKREQDARRRIQDALENLKKQQRAFTTIELRDLAGCSRETLYHHQDIWRALYEDRKNYQDLAAGFWAGCTDEYNVAVCVHAPPIESSSPDPTFLTPPGLLACWQVSFELSRLTLSEKRQHERLCTAQRTLEEGSWRACVVAALRRCELSSAELATLRTVLSLLVYFLSIAPVEEDALWLQSEITELKNRIDRCYGTSLRLVGKPPPGD